MDSKRRRQRACARPSRMLSVTVAGHHFGEDAIQHHETGNVDQSTNTCQHVQTMFVLQ
jgi:hypothetical protein